MKLTFYTVYFHRAGYPVHWLDPEKHEEQVFTIPDHPFHDPVEAMGEFEACVGGAGSCYLEVAPFRAKVNAFKKQHQRQHQQLTEWNAAVKGV